LAHSRQDVEAIPVVAQPINFIKI